MKNILKKQLHFNKLKITKPSHQLQVVFGEPDLYPSEVSVWLLIMLKPNTRASRTSL